MLKNKKTELDVFLENIMGEGREEKDELNKFFRLTDFSASSGKSEWIHVPDTEILILPVQKAVKLLDMKSNDIKYLIDTIRKQYKEIVMTNYYIIVDTTDF